MGQTHEGVVLRAIIEAGQSGHVLIGVSELVEHTGLDHRSVQRELSTLLSCGHGLFRSVLDPNDGSVLAVHSITAHARRAAASGLGVSMLHATSSAEHVVAGPGSRGQKVLRGFAKAVGVVTLAVASKVVAALITGTDHRP